MSVIVMGAFFWWGLLGLASVVMGILTVFFDIKGAFEDAAGPRLWEEIKHRDAWLLQHFGVAGRARWLSNLEYLEKMKDKVFGEPHRGADGKCSGNVRGVFKFYTNRFPNRIYLHWSYSCEVPLWGCNKGPYDPNHKRHREPRGCDWLAAGFWDPIVRDDGVVIDPMALLRADIYRKNGGSSPCHFDGEAEMIKEIRAEIFKKWSHGEIEKPLWVLDHDQVMAKIRAEKLMKEYASKRAARELSNG